MPKDIPSVLNWRRIDDRITTSGQPTADQFAQICDLGVGAIINLAPSDNKGALINEADLIASLGLSYAYIPVDFSDPTDADFDQFCEAMRKFDGECVHVHCIYNARVTAFMTRYIREISGGDATAMVAIMDDIWRPGGVWADFLGDVTNRSLPNRYKGYEYD